MSYSVLHRFSYDEKNGAVTPLAGLINVDGTLYGTTFGKVSKSNGTVFSINTSGKHETLYRFDVKNGSGPWDAPLLDLNGTLYGTTFNGGASGHGAV